MEDAGERVVLAALRGKRYLGRLWALLLGSLWLLLLLQIPRRSGVLLLRPGRHRLLLGPLPIDGRYLPLQLLPERRARLEWAACRLSLDG